MEDHFSKRAKEWDSPEKVEFAQKVAHEFESILSQNGIKISKDWNVMEFGCGTGNVGLNFAAKVNKLVGIDVSEGMLEVMEEKVKKLGYKNVKTVKLELSEKNTYPEKFNCILSSLTFHHIKDTAKMFQLLASHLEDDGILVFADLKKTEISQEFHPKEVHEHVHHHGFDSEDLKKWLNAAGFKTIVVTTPLKLKMSKHGHDKKLKEFDVLVVYAKK